MWRVFFTRRSGLSRDTRVERLHASWYPQSFVCWGQAWVCWGILFSVSGVFLSSKYGKKLVLANDSQSKYVASAIPYLGKEGTEPPDDIMLGHHFTKELTKPYHESIRNVTAGDWYASVPLVTDLLRNCGMTLVGTVKENKKIPKKMTESDSRALGSSGFLFINDMTLVSHTAETSKTEEAGAFAALSAPQPSLRNTGKSEVIDVYSVTIRSVDTLNQMCVHYSCSGKTKRWPLCVLYGMLNAGYINSCIIHSENVAKWSGKQVTRRKYMQELTRSLILTWAQNRLTSPF